MPGPDHLGAQPNPYYDPISSLSSQQRPDKFGPYMLLLQYFSLPNMPNQALLHFYIQFNSIFRWECQSWQRKLEKLSFDRPFPSYAASLSSPRRHTHTSPPAVPVACQRSAPGRACKQQTKTVSVLLKLGTSAQLTATYGYAKVCTLSEFQTMRPW